MKKKVKEDYQYYQEITLEGLVDTKPVKKVEEKKKDSWYKYEGPVKRYDQIIIPHFKAETLASSDQKAKSNILFQAKKHMNMAPYTGGFTLVKDIIKM